MIRLETYTCPEDFLTAASYLEQQEMKHNVILGNCYNLIQENKSYEGCYFLNAFSGNTLVASSVRLSPKIILSAAGKEGIHEIFQFYMDKGIQYSGVIGDLEAVETFTSMDLRTPIQKRITLIQSLEKITQMRLPPGSLVQAGSADLDRLQEWILSFFRDENLLPERTAEMISTQLETLGKYNNLFVWTQGSRIVSMSAIIRRTRNTAIIGLVYTPPEYRGKGYAKACVHELSVHILKNSRQSGLLVYERNEAARHIYQSMGYHTVSELMDLDLERS